MHITIFGASRGVGRAAVDAALAAGHAVTAFARSTDSLSGSAASIITGDVRDSGAVATALAGADAVIVALGVSPGQRGNTPEDICSTGTRTILAQMDAMPADRLVVVTSYGVGATKPLTPFPFSLIAKTLLKGIMADKERQEADVRASRTRWTIVQPLGLTDGAATGKPFVSTDGKRASNRVPRADVAAVCIAALDDDRYIGEAIAVSA